MPWTGRVLTALVVLFLVFDGTIKLVPLQVVTDTMGELGYPATPELARSLGALRLICNALYAWP